MAIEKATLPLPVGGWNTSAGRENQPEGTTRGTKNARNRDWRAGGALRLARRAGMTKFVDEQPCGDNPFQALGSIGVLAATGESTIVASLLTDTMTRADTSAGNLGNFDGSGGSDYYIAVKSGFDPSGTTAINQSWSAAYAAGTAAKILSNKCVDEQSADTDTGTAVLSLCYFRPDGATLAPTNNYSAKLTFTMDPVNGGSGTQEAHIGLFCFGDTGQIGAAQRDEAFWCGLGITPSSPNFSARVNQGFNDTTVTTVGKTFADGYLYNQPTGLPDTKKPVFTDSGLIDGGGTSAALAPGSQHVLEIRVSGKRVELLLDSLSWLIWDDVTQKGDGSGTTPVDTTKTHFGFYFYNVGSGSRAAIASIDKFEVSSITVSSPSPTVKVVTVNGGDVCHGNESTEFATATNGSGVFSADATVFLLPGLGPSSSGGKSYIYALDGNDYRKILVTALSGTVLTWTAASGTLPAGSSDTSRKARYGALWRNRIVLWGVDTNPDNWYMSASGDADDWDYTATPNGREAIAGDNSGTGLAPGGITCMAGFDDDNLIMGLVDSLIVMRGDPALGGALDGITDRVGIVGPRATALSDQGVFYFVDRTGLYAIEPGTSQPQRLTHEKIDEFFEDVDWDTTDAVLFYSRRFDGLRVWLVPRTVPTDSTQTIKSLWWDGSNTPWYDEFPAFLYPRAVCGYQTGNENIMLVGGTDGYLRRFTPDSADDDGNKIDSYVDLSPIVADGETEIGLNEMILKPGSTCERFTVQMRSAMGADGLDSAAFRHLVRVNGPAAALRAMSIPPRIDRRIRGGAVGVRIGDSEKYWSIEQARALLDTGYALAGGH